MFIGKPIHVTGCVTNQLETYYAKVTLHFEIPLQWYNTVDGNMYIADDNK